MKIYLDNNATTKLCIEAIKAMQDEMVSTPSNPSSPHSFGRAAKMRLDRARTAIAKLLGCLSKEVLFTGSATEAMTTLINSHASKHIITSTIEHSCIYNLCKEFENTTFIKPSQSGEISVDVILASLTSAPTLIALSAANGETGTLLDIEKLCNAIQNYDNVTLLIDGVALLGKAPFSFHPRIDAIVFSAHKLHGPTGCGIACVRKRFKIKPLILGGGQEKGVRSGTENLIAIAGAEAAIEAALLELSENADRMRKLRDLFEKNINSEFPQLIINGEKADRLPHVSNLCFPGFSGESLLIHLDLNDVSVSLGSACSAGAIEPSRVLLEMGLSNVDARSSLRFSLSRFTSKEEISAATSHLLAFLKK